MPTKLSIQRLSERVDRLLDRLSPTPEYCVITCQASWSSAQMREAWERHFAQFPHDRRAKLQITVLRFSPEPDSDPAA
jgi:hypothetical protein